MGEHSNVLPHITLTRSTLPWERKADNTKEDSSWLVLLLFRDQEKPTPITLTLKQLKDSNKYPTFVEEVGQQEQDEVTVIDVSKSLLEEILPTEEDLKYLAHVRQGKEASGNPLGEEMATILCNRLPKKGDTSTVHLVSVENRYKNGSFDYQNPTSSDGLIRFVSLKSWSFSCEDKAQDFTHLLDNLDGTPSTVRLKDTNNKDADQNLRQGYILLPHSLRNGQKTLSWYRGPLIPGKNVDKLTEPLPMTADELMRYNESNKLFDISYAAAWELGRLLVLQNKHLAVELFNWKHQRAHKERIKNQQKESHLLPFQIKGSDDNNSVPEHIKAWFCDLELLKEIPFNYLVPDDRILPPESIRFFWVDPYWVDCLRDGAFSIGRVTDNNKDEDRESKKCLAKQYLAQKDIPQEDIPKQEKPVSGFLMRSDVVSGWPSLEVDGYKKVFNDKNFVHDESHKLKLLRMERLAPNVLLCLFNGEVKTVDIFQKAEAMYFGLPPNGKTLRKLEDTQLSEQIKSKQEVLNIRELAEVIKNELNITPPKDFTSAQFAAKMIQEVKKVRFTLKP